MNRRQFLQRLMMTPAVLPALPGILSQEPEVETPKVEVQRPSGPIRSASAFASGSSFCFTTSWSAPWDDGEVYEPDNDIETDLYYSGHGDDLKDRIKWRTE